MLNTKEIAHYDRHLMMPEIGLEGQLKLKASSVLVIGAGGLGCPVLQYLTAAGVGEIGIADFDLVQASNLQRQVLYGYSSIGKLKAEAAKERLSDLNPHCSFVLYTTRITAVNVCDIIESYQVIIDCTDNFSTRYLINDACVLMDKPLVYGAIHRMEGQVSVFNYQQGPTYRCLFDEAPESNAGTNCSEIGVLGALPGVIGTFQAIEAIKIIVGIGEPLSGKLLLYDARSSAIQFVKLIRKEHPIYSQQQMDADRYEQNCISEKQNWEIFYRYEQIIDVRELHEEPRIELSTVKPIPLNELSTRIQEIDTTQRTLIVCHSGKRSHDALIILKEQTKMMHVEHLDSGIAMLLTASSSKLMTE